jgi:hypothetical protein
MLGYFSPTLRESTFPTICCKVKLEEVILGEAKMTYCLLATFRRPACSFDVLNV